MNELTILEYRDRGTGLQPVPAADVPAGSPLWGVTSQLMNRLISQPSGALDTRRHPVWSLHRTDAAGVAYWCFAVQAGMNGALGAAGGCQFAFAPGDWPPAQVWSSCVARVDAGQLTGLSAGSRPLPAAPAGPAARDVEQLVQALLREQERIAVMDDPQDVAQLFAAVFRVLPAGLIARYLWSTCLLQPPFDSLPVVAGRWPEDFRRTDGRGARVVDDWLRRGTPAPTAITGRAREAVDWLVHEATTKSVRAPFAPTARVGVDTMPALLELIARDQLSISVRDVPRLLESAEGQHRLARDAPELCADWADTQPGQARDVVARGRTDPRLAWQLVRGLMERSLRTGRDELVLPDRSDADGSWSRLVAGILSTRLSVDEIAAWLRQVYARGQDPRRALVDRRESLERLGLSRSASPDLFPVDLDGMVLLLANGRGLPGWARQELLHAADPGAEVGVLLTRVGPTVLTPRDAALLVEVVYSKAAAAGRDPAGVVERVVARRWRADPATAGGWTRELLGRLGTSGPPEAVGAVCDAALACLVDSTGQLSSGSGLRTALELMAADSSRPPAERSVFDALRQQLEEPRRGWFRRRRRHELDERPWGDASDASDASIEPPARSLVSGSLWVVIAVVVFVVSAATGLTIWFTP